MTVELKNVNLRIPYIFDKSLKQKIMQSSITSKRMTFESGDKSIHVLKNINLKLVEGDKCGIIGDNGSGKTSLLKVISGVYEPNDGELKVKGSIGSILNIDAGLQPEATGRENIIMRCLIMGIQKKVLDKKVDEIIKFSMLKEFIDLQLKTYSSGMRLKLAFSIATSIFPEIVIMDEWIAAGDKKFRNIAMDKLNSIIKQSKILILASHNPEIIAKVCNKAIKLDNGEIVEVFDPKKVYHYI